MRKKSTNVSERNKSLYFLRKKVLVFKGSFGVKNVFTQGLANSNEHSAKNVLAMAVGSTTPKTIHWRVLHYHCQYEGVLY